MNIHHIILVKLRRQKSSYGKGHLTWCSKNMAPFSGEMNYRSTWYFVFIFELRGEPTSQLASKVKLQYTKTKFDEQKYLHGLLCMSNRKEFPISFIKVINQQQIKKKTLEAKREILLSSGDGKEKASNLTTFTLEKCRFSIIKSQLKWSTKVL